MKKKKKSTEKRERTLRCQSPIVVSLFPLTRLYFFFPPERVATICHPSRLYLLMWKTQSLIKDAWERDTSGRQKNQSKDRMKGWNQQ